MLTDKPLTEDGFYLLTVARHLALGNGLSIDGVHLTNGIQPLFTFLAAPAYWLFGGDRFEALRGVLLLHGLLFVGSAWLFGSVLRDATAGGERLRWLGSLSWLASGYLFLLAHNGLETGCLLFLYLACWRTWQRWPLRGVGSAVAHGALLGVLVLARIDATFFVAALCASHVLRGEGRLGLRVRDAALVGAVAAVVSSPWWIYNLVNFGSLMPTSGTAQGATLDSTVGIVASRAAAAATNLLLVATPMLYGGDGAGGRWFLALRVVFLIGVVIALWRLPRVEGPPARTASGGRPVAIALLSAGLVLVVWYACRFWATHFYGRYFVPLAPFGMAMWAIAADRAVARAPRLLGLLVAGLAIAAVGVAAIAHTGALFAGNQWLHDQVSLVRDHVPPGARLAAGQSGTLGYFVDGVRNLDGKVNAEALRHQGSMGVYLAGQRIEWLCDWPEYVQRYVPPASLATDWQFVDRRGEFELWRRRGL